MKLYTHQVIGWDNEKREDILKKIIINSEDIITISDFEYLKTHVLLKNGQYFVCGTVFFRIQPFIMSLLMTQKKLHVKIMNFTRNSIV